MHFLKIVFTFCLIFSFTGCKSQKKAMPQENNSANSQNLKNKKSKAASKTGSNIINLFEKQNVFLKEQQMNVTFNKLLNDSRCPKDVQCISAGNATVEIELMMTYSRPRIYQLSLGTLSDGQTNFANFSGYKITLINLLPYPTNTIDKQDLDNRSKIELKIEKQ